MNASKVSRTTTLELLVKFSATFSSVILSYHTVFFFFFFNHTVFNSFHEGKDWSLPYLLALSTIFFFFLIWLHWVLGKARGIFVVVCMIFSCSMWDLVPWPGIEPWTPAFGAWSITTGPPEKSHNILNMVKS